MMPNHPANEELFAYRDGELEGERRSLVEAHVLSCTACQTRLDDTSDAEGMLRQGLQDPSDAYFERLTGSVMARVTGAQPAAAPGAAGAPGRGPDREPKAARPAEAPRGGRRRNFDDAPRGRAPGLPWPAILSAASAAAAVLVVVVILVKRQDAWRHAPPAGVVGLPDGRGAESPAAEPDVRRDEAPAPTEAEAPPAAATAPLEERREVAGDLAVPSPADALRDQTVAKREEEIATESAADAVPEVALQKSAENSRGRVAAPGGKPDAASGAAAVPEGPAFAEVAGRYGLPLLYDPARVPGSALLRAEPELRLLYLTGRAGDDSARVRLYLAEAARERGAGSFDAETFDAIVHHYRRAAALARDGETARMARKRLEDFVSRNAPGP